MGSFLIGARIVLACVFAVAGVAKLRDQAGSRRSLSDFGVPPKVVPVAAVLLPLAELSTAAALVPTGSARWGALAALLLLLLFMGGIVNALAHGQAPDCNCFGQLYSAPVDRGVLARNATLAAGAAIVVAEGPGPAIDSWFPDRTAAELLAVGASAAALALAAIAFRQWTIARRLQRELTDARTELAALPPGLPVGAEAPNFRLSDIHGTARTLESLTARGRPVLLVFVSPNCDSCTQLLPELSRWQAMLADSLTVAVVSSGTAADNRVIAEEHGVADVLLQENAEVSKVYRIGFTPSAVVVSAQRRIASAPAEGVLAIEPLIRLTLRRGMRAPAGIGTPAGGPAH